jgi:hypothetical protein
MLQCGVRRLHDEVQRLPSWPRYYALDKPRPVAWSARSSGPAANGRRDEEKDR